MKTEQSKLSEASDKLLPNRRALGLEGKVDQQVEAHGKDPPACSPAWLVLPLEQSLGEKTHGA